MRWLVVCVGECSVGVPSQGKRNTCFFCKWQFSVGDRVTCTCFLEMKFDQMFILWSSTQILSLMLSQIMVGHILAQDSMEKCMYEKKKFSRKLKTLLYPSFTWRIIIWFFTKFGVRGLCGSCESMVFIIYIIEEISSKHFNMCNVVNFVLKNAERAWEPLLCIISAMWTQFE